MAATPSEPVDLDAPATDLRRRATQQASTGNYWAGKALGLLDYLAAAAGELEAARQQAADAQREAAEVEEVHRTVARLWSLARQRAERVEDEAAALRVALGRYGEHEWTCATKATDDCNAICSCGLTAALAGTQPEPQEHRPIVSMMVGHPTYADGYYWDCPCGAGSYGHPSSASAHASASTHRTATQPEGEKHA